MVRFFRRLDFYIFLLVLLVNVQMVWWLIFFFDFQQKYISLKDDYNHILLMMLNNQKLDRFPDIVFFDSQENLYKIKKDVLLETEKLIRKNKNMLIWEASFFVLVLIALSFLIHRFYYKQQLLLQEKTIFLNSFTHELKTPITAIKLNLQTIQRKMQNNNQIFKNLIQSSLEEIELLNQKINKILYDKEIRLQPIQKISRINIEELMNDVIKGLEKEIQKKQAKVLVKNPLPIQVVYLSIPSQWLGFVLNEIILNSLKYSNNQVIIQIEVSIIDLWFTEFLKISVIDNGWGVPDENIKEIIKPYKRYHTDKGYIEGTGLGLYYVKEIIKKSKGKLTIKNQQKGLRVDIYLKKYNKIYE